MLVKKQRKNSFIILFIVFIIIFYYMLRVTTVVELNNGNWSFEIFSNCLNELYKIATPISFTTNNVVMSLGVAFFVLMLYETYRSFTGLDIIKDYAEKGNSPKFIIVSFTPEAGLVYRYKNVADCVTKYPKINCSELSYKIICAKRTIWKEQQDLIENKILEEKKKNSFWGKLKRLIVE